MCLHGPLTGMHDVIKCLLWDSNFLPQFVSTCITKSSKCNVVIEFRQMHVWALVTKQGDSLYGMYCEWKNEQLLVWFMGTSYIAACTRHARVDKGLNLVWLEVSQLRGSVKQCTSLALYAISQLWIGIVLNGCIKWHWTQRQHWQWSSTQDWTYVQAR